MDAQSVAVFFLKVPAPHSGFGHFLKLFFACGKCDARFFRYVSSLNR